MHPLIRLLASVALVQLSVLAVQAAESPPDPPEQSRQNPLESFVPPAPVPGDLDHLQGILKAYRDNDLPEAQILKTKLTQPAAHALVEWFAIRSGLTTSLDRIVSFRKDYPEWPSTGPIRRRGEDALLAERRPAAQVRAYFAKQPREPRPAGSLSPLP